MQFTKNHYIYKKMAKKSVKKVVTPQEVKDNPFDDLIEVQPIKKSSPSVVKVLKCLSLTDEKGAIRRVTLIDKSKRETDIFFEPGDGDAKMFIVGGQYRFMIYEH